MDDQKFFDCIGFIQEDLIERVCQKLARDGDVHTLAFLSTQNRVFHQHCYPYLQGIKALKELTEKMELQSRKNMMNVSGWNLYMKDQMKVVKDLYKIGASWKALPEVTKNEWRAKSVALKSRTLAIFPPVKKSAGY